MTARDGKVDGGRSARSEAGRTPGFTLIMTVTVLVLLALVAIGMLTLSTITVRSASADRALMEARANARLALLLAIGELQAKAGIDQAVTAEGSLMIPNGFAGAAVADAKRHYVGTWSLEDIKNPTGEEAPGGRARQQESFRGWLVSGDPNATSKLSFGSEALAGEEVRIVGPGTVGGNRADLEVRVPLTTTQSEGGRTTGAYAWWVSDCGVKATVSMARSAAEELGHLAPARFGIAKVAGMDWFPSADVASLRKIPTLLSADLLGSDAEGMGGRYHWLTAMHRGVLSDTKRGGLKGDLTVALGSGRSGMEKMLGERIFAPVEGEPTAGDPGGPWWEQVRQYYQSGGRDALEVRPQTADQMGVYPVVAGFVEMYGLTNTLGYAPSASPHPSLAANWYNKRSNGKWAYMMTMHMAPVVKLWNPYNRPIRAGDGLTVSVMNNTYQHGTSGEGSYEDIMWWGRNGGSSNIDARPPKTMRYEHRYYIPPVEFEPGEVRVFALTENTFLDLDGTYRAYGNKRLGKKTSVVNNGWILGDLEDITTSGFTGHCFWDMMFTKRYIPRGDRETLNWGGGRSIGGHGGTDSGDIQVLDSERPGGLGFQVEPHSFSTWNIKLYEGRAKLPKQGVPDGALPLVNMKNINTDTTGFLKGNTSFIYNRNPERIPVFATPSGQDSIWARRAVLRMVLNEDDDNMRIYNQVAHPTKDVKWLANFNPRSPTFGCWPYEHRKAENNNARRFSGSRSPLVINGTSYSGQDGYGLGTVGNYLSGMLPELTSQDALFLNQFVGFSDLGGPERCVLFEYPQVTQPESHFMSPGQLRQANLWIENGSYGTALGNGHGAEDWFGDNMHPAYPIGNSYADPRIPRDENHGRYIKLGISDEISSYESTHYDLSWFLNEALWDRYYFSAWRADGGEISNNPRLVAHGPDEPTDGEEGYAQNAARMLLHGAFNVNSTSEEAWKAFLASLMEEKVVGRTSSGAPFARHAQPVGNEVLANTHVDELENYTGFRTLEEAELQDLAERIVEEVKLRGPFLSLAEFVNRAAFDDLPVELQLKGALQAAIDRTPLNEQQEGQGDYVIDAGRVGEVYDPEAFAGDVAAGVPGYLTQGDIMARLGHLMTARSDTFRVRGYGESRDAAGNVRARAKCEAIVQRVPEFVDATVAADERPADLGEDSVARRFGRQFEIGSFRWLGEDD